MLHIAFDILPIFPLLFRCAILANVSCSHFLSNSSAHGIINKNWFSLDFKIGFEIYDGSNTVNYIMPCLHTIKVYQSWKFHASHSADVAQRVMPCKNTHKRLKKTNCTLEQNGIINSIALLACVAAKICSNNWHLSGSSSTFTSPQHHS